MDYKQCLTKKTAAIRAATVTCIMLVLYLASAFSSSTAEVELLQLQTAESIPSQIRRLRALSPNDFAEQVINKIEVSEQDFKRFDYDLPYTDEKIAELAGHLPSMIVLLTHALRGHHVNNKDDLKSCLMVAHKRFSDIVDSRLKDANERLVTVKPELKDSANALALNRAVDEYLVAREKKLHYIGTEQYLYDVSMKEIEEIAANSLADPSVQAETVASIVPFQEMDYIKKHGFGDDFSDLKKRGIVFEPNYLDRFNFGKLPLADDKDILKIAGGSRLAASIIAQQIWDNDGVMNNDELTNCLHRAYKRFWSALWVWFKEGMKELGEANPSLMLASNVAQLRQAMSAYLEAREQSEMAYGSSYLPGSLYTWLYNRKPSQKEVKKIAKKALALNK